MRKIEREPNGKGILKPGQDLVVAGVIGKAGVKAAFSERKSDIRNRFPAYFVERIKAAAERKVNLTPEKLSALGAAEWEYIEEGGVLTALWNLSGAYEQGISFDLRKIPVSQELIEVCELFDLNPYRLMSGECVLIAADHGGDMVNALKEQEITAAVIGKVEQGIARKMVGFETTGYLERPQRDEIYKIIG